MTLQDYIADGLAGFASDPADSDFQLGYRAALFEVKKMVDERVIDLEESAIKIKLHRD